jgi:hypothetical protein
VVVVWVLCQVFRVERVNGWQRKRIRCGCGDVCDIIGFVEVCRVLPDPGFVYGVEVVVVVVGSV